MKDRNHHQWVANTSSNHTDRNFHHSLIIAFIANNQLFYFNVNHTRSMEDVDVDSPKMDHANRIKSSCQATKSSSNWITYIFLPFNGKRSNYYSHENTTSKTTLRGGLESKLILIIRAMDRARFVGVPSSRHQTTELRSNAGSMPVQRLRRLAWHIEPALNCGLVFWRNVHQVRVRDQLRSLGADMGRRVRREGVPLDVKGCICHF